MVIYTDGGCRDNGHDVNVGSWAFVVAVNDGDKIACCQKINNTTNNRTEMLAIINAIIYANSVHNNDYLDIITDSGLCYNGWNQWIDGWVNNNWITSNKTPVLNRDLWEKMLRLAYHNPFELKHCRGHGKDTNYIRAYWNSIADEACTMAMDFNDNDIHMLKYCDTHMLKCGNKNLFTEMDVKEDGWNEIHSSTGCKPPTKG